MYVMCRVFYMIKITEILIVKSTRRKKNIEQQKTVKIEIKFVPQQIEMIYCDYDQQFVYLR